MIQVYCSKWMKTQHDSQAWQKVKGMGDRSRELSDPIFNHKHKTENKVEVRPGYDLSNLPPWCTSWTKALPPYRLLRIALLTGDQASKHPSRRGTSFTSQPPCLDQYSLLHSFIYLFGVYNIRACLFACMWKPEADVRFFLYHSPW